MADQNCSPVPEPAWPLCPQCGAKRVTRCTFCSTAGTDFLPAEVDFGRLLGLPGNAARGSCCGPGGCSPVKDVLPEEELHQLGGPSGAAAPADAPMLLCPTCSEPFTPQFSRLCRDCGHEFPDGFDPSLVEQANDGSDRRILVCVVGIAIFTAATLIYLWRLF